MTFDEDYDSGGLGFAAFMCVIALVVGLLFAHYNLNYKPSLIRNDLNEACNRHGLGNMTEYKHATEPTRIKYICEDSTDIYTAYKICLQYDKFNIDCEREGWA